MRVQRPARKAGDRDRDERRGRRGDEDAPAHDTPRHRPRDDGRTRRVERDQPRRVAVGAAAEPVEHDDHPHGEVRVVGAAPVPVGHAIAVVVGHREREQQLGADDAQRDPDRPVRATSTESRATRPRTAGTNRSRSSSTWMPTNVPTSRPPKRWTSSIANFGHRCAPARAAGHRDAERHHHREQHVGDHPRRPRRVPVERTRRQVHAGTPVAVQAWLTVTAPSAATNRAGIPRASSHAGPSLPTRNPAFAAASAATQVAPHAVTCSQRRPPGVPSPRRSDDGGHPRRVSTAVSSCRSSRARHGRDRDRRPAGSTVAAAHRDVAPRRHEPVAREQLEAASTVARLDDAVQVEPHAGRGITRRPSRRIARHRPGAAGPGAAGSATSSSKSRVYPADSMAAPSVGSSRPAVCSASWSATLKVSANRGETVTQLPAWALTWLSSLSVAEPAEDPVALGEQLGDLSAFGCGAPGHDDVAAHCTEPLGCHDTLVAAPGGASAGASRPASSRFWRTIWTNPGGAASAVGRCFGWPAYETRANDRGRAEHDHAGDRERALCAQRPLPGGRDARRGRRRRGGRLRRRTPTRGDGRIGDARHGRATPAFSRIACHCTSESGRRR